MALISSFFLKRGCYSFCNYKFDARKHAVAKIITQSKIGKTLNFSHVKTLHYHFAHTGATIQTKSLPWLGAGRLHTWKVSWHFLETTSLPGLDSLT